MTARPSAFTLIELLAATTLAALLMIALLAVIASLGRTQAAFDRADDSTGWPIGLVDVIRRDLINADQFTSADGVVTLRGPVALDITGEAVTHRTATVRYRIHEMGDRRWLVREQTEGESGNSSALLLCPDIQAISLDRAGVIQGGPQVAPIGLHQNDQTPRSVRLLIRPAQRHRSDLNITIILQ